MIHMEIYRIFVDVEEETRVLSAPFVDRAYICLRDEPDFVLFDDLMQIGQLIIVLRTVGMVSQQIFIRRALRAAVQIGPDQFSIRLQIRADRTDQIIFAVEGAKVVDRADIRKNVDTAFFDRITACFIYNI